MISIVTARLMFSKYTALLITAKVKITEAAKVWACLKPSNDWSPDRRDPLPDCWLWTPQQRPFSESKVISSPRLASVNLSFPRFYLSRTVAFPLAGER
jgi:hypothetical protein